MFRRDGLVLFAAILLTTIAMSQPRAASDLQIQRQSLPSAAIGRPYSATIQVNGGTAPFGWKITKGMLPPGIVLQTTSGILSGTPTSPGEYSFTVAVTDTSHQSVAANFTIKVEDYLTVRWKQGPTLDQDTLSGTVEVRNGSSDTYDQTVIIVAVNEIGKAFALGYQHFDLSPQSQQTIPYSSALPNGHYIVHVDAVAEIAARHLIRRARLQTTDSIAVNVNR
jgi:hypothetical protein